MSVTNLRGKCCGSIEFEGIEVLYEAEVTGSEEYIPGRMYMPNGDPGYPDEWDCSDISLYKITCVDTDQELYSQNKEAIDQAIREDVEENTDWDDVEWREDEYEPEPPEYDPDDYDNWDFE